MKNKLVLALALLFCTVGFSENVSLSYGPQEVKRVGPDEIWFMTSLRKDSALCAKEVVGNCVVNTSFTQLVERVKIESSISDKDATAARISDVPVPNSSIPLMDQAVSLDWGLSLDYPADVTVIHYDSKEHSIAFRHVEGAGSRTNAISIIVVLLLGIWLISTMFPRNIEAYFEEDHDTHPYKCINFTFALYVSLLIWSIKAVPFGNGNVNSFVAWFLITIICFVLFLFKLSNDFYDKPFVNKYSKTVTLMSVLLFFAACLEVFYIQSNINHGIRWIGCVVGSALVVHIFRYLWRKFSPKFRKASPQAQA